MANDVSGSLLIICRQKTHCLTQVLAILKDPKEETSVVLKRLLALASTPLVQNGQFPSESNNPDVLIAKAEETNIGVSQIRGFQQQISQKPTHRQTKIVIFPQSEKLTPEAQNALLKTLEEPPENVIIILIAPDPDLLLATVVSRCRLVFLTNSNENLSPKDQKAALEILQVAAEQAIGEGFAWAKTVGAKRIDALGDIEKLIFASHQALLENHISPLIVRKLFQAKKYLLANTNVRLTLENLFLD